MRLSDYLAGKGEKPYGFAKRAGIPIRTMYDIIDGGGSRAETALRIVEASNGQVTLKDIVEAHTEAREAVERLRNV